MAEQGSELTRDEMGALPAFLGYGKAAGKYWFIGMEEQGDGSPAEMKARATWDGIKDLNDTCSDPATLARNQGKDPRSMRVPAWRTMIRIVLLLEGNPNWREPQTVEAYLWERFGWRTGDVFLGENIAPPSSQPLRMARSVQESLGNETRLPQRNLAT